MKDKFESLCFSSVSDETWQLIELQGLNEKMDAFKQSQWLEAEFSKDATNDDLHEVSRQLQDKYGSNIIAMFNPKSGQIRILKLVYRFS